MLLADVALGGTNQKYYSDYYADQLPEGKHSTMGCGKTGPPKDSYVDFNGAQMP